MADKEVFLYKRKKGPLPWGYRVDPDDKFFLEPIPAQLLALKEAKKYLKTCSYREVAVWLSRVTGRKISHVALYKMINKKEKIGRYNPTSAAEAAAWCS